MKHVNESTWVIYDIAYHGFDDHMLIAIVIVIWVHMGGIHTKQNIIVDHYCQYGWY